MEMCIYSRSNLYINIILPAALELHVVMETQVLSKYT